MSQEKLEYIDFIDEYTIKISLKNMENIIIDLFDRFSKEYKNNLAEIFAGREEDFKISSFNIDSYDAIIQYIKNNNSEQKKENIKNSFSHSPYFDLLQITTEYFLFSYEKNKNQFDEKTKIRKQDLLFILLNYIASSFTRKAFILSAERTGASMFQKELDVNKNEIVERISRANTKNIQQTVFNVLNSNYSRYPKPVKDNIYFIRELDEIDKKK